MTTINEYTFFLDSKYRTSGSNSSPSFQLDTPIFLNDPNNYFLCQIMSVEFPFSFKTLYAPNNVIPIRLQIPGLNLDVSSIITIPEGNYSILTLLDNLKLLLTDYITSTGFTQIPTFDFIYNKDTGKTTLKIIPSGGNHNLTLTLKWMDADIIAEYFGFSYLNNTVLSFTGSTITSINYTSPNNVNVSPITAFYIRSSSLNQTSYNQERLVEPFFTVSDILLKVPVSSYANTWIIYENGSFSVRLNNKSIDELSFYITAQTYDSLLINGVHWKISLKISEFQPEFVKLFKENELKNTENIKSLQDEKDKLIKELEMIKDDLRNTLISQTKNNIHLRN
jgi:hypothetical protein